MGNTGELITGKDLTQLEIVVRDDNEKSEGFSLKLPDSVFDLTVYKYLKHGDPFVTTEGYHTARSAYNFQNSPMAQENRKRVWLFYEEHEYIQKWVLF